MPSDKLHCYNGIKAWFPVMKTQIPCFALVVLGIENKMYRTI